MTAPAPASRNPLQHRKSSLSQEIRPNLSAHSSFAPGPSTPAVEHSPKTVYTLGSRSSQLALVQTHIVRDALEKMHPTFSFPIITMNTAGDKNQSQALYLLGGKALWTEELEAALHARQIDIIVHSLKDIPTVLSDEFTLSAVLERADPRDALVVKKGLEEQYKTLEDLPDGSVVGTSSVRRVAQLKRSFPNLKFLDVRGNLNTRLAKLDAPESPFTAIILAHAGLVRINLGHRSTSLIDPPTLHYAVGQGALGIETRSLDPEVAFVVKDIGHWQTEWRTAAERGCLRKLEGGCSVPVGVESSLEVEKDEGPESGEGGRKGKLSLRGTVTSLDGSEHVVHGEVDVEVGSFAECERLGTKVAEELIAKGAGKILIAIEEGKNQKGTVVGTEVLAAAPAH